MTHKPEDNFWRGFQNWIKSIHLSNRIFLWYVIFVLLGMVLLATPGIVHGQSYIQDGSVKHPVNFQWNFLYALFNAASAFSDTGLSIPSAAADYSFWGQLIIAILIEIGGFGVLTFKIMIWIMIGRKLKLKDIILVQEERGSNEFGATIRLIKQSFIFLFFTQIVAAIVLFFLFYFSKPLAQGGESNVINAYKNFSRALWLAFFQSISAINNAGFDIIGKNSLQPYHTNYLIQFILVAEFVIGGLGFPVFYDLAKNRFGFKQDSHLRLFTKINLVTYLGLSLGSVGLICAIEYGTNSSAVLQNYGKGFGGFMAIFFNTMSTRNAGFYTVPTVTFLGGSKIIQALMMFIGSAPSSTAGGIRTTTFAVLIIATWHTLRRRENYSAFKRKISQATVNRAGVVLFVSAVLVMIVGGLIVITHPSLSPLDVFYTTCSAFGTVGLNNLTPWTMYQLGIADLLAMILLMFIGQLGVSATLLSITSGRRPKQDWEYVQEDMRIG